MRLMRESLILIAIGLADLWWTIQLVDGHTVSEGNPIMAYYLQFGVGAFVIVKLLLLLLPVFVAEWSKLYRPQFVKWMLRGAIATYVGLYVIGFAIYNVQPILDDHHRTAPAGPVRQVTIAEAQKR